MPIYEYRCSSCGFQKEYLRKVSDPLLNVCPECGKETFGKMLTAAGFQLKGGGWYATDFKHSGCQAREQGREQDRRCERGQEQERQRRQQERQQDRSPAGRGACGAGCRCERSQG